MKAVKLKFYVTSMGRSFGIGDSKRVWKVLKSLRDLGFWQGGSSVAEKMKCHFACRTKLEDEQSSNQFRVVELRFNFLRL